VPNFVIPAWMPESSAMDGNLPIVQVPGFKVIGNPQIAIHGRWISASLPK
jgi:hypothetical protein